MKITEIGVAACLCSLILGFNLGGQFPPAQRKPLPPELDPAWFQTNECKTNTDEAKACVLKIQPRKMTLEFVTRDQFNSMMPPPSAVAGYGLGGFARVDKSPCEIVIPIDDAQLASHPYELFGHVRWSGPNYNMDFTIAHEILHCYAGHWHEDYIPGLKFRDRFETSRSVRSYENRLFVDYVVQPRLKPQSWDLRPSFMQTSIALLASK